MVPAEISSTAARLLIQREFAPRRARFRRALMHALVKRPPPLVPGARDWMLSRVHELCGHELAERVRIAADALRQAYAGHDVAHHPELAGILKEEVEHYLSAELSDLAADEALVARVLTHLPRMSREALRDLETKLEEDAA